MSESDSETHYNETQTSRNGDLAAQLAELLKQINSQPKSHTNPPSDQDHPESLGEVNLKTKLNGDNYPLWSNLMKRAIIGKGLSSHIAGVTDPPPTSDPKYFKWEQRDNCCFNWIINNIEGNLINEVSQYATARDLWESLAITYGSGADPFQVSDLHRQAYNMKQGGMSLETLWTKFQDIWLSIDARDPNPMDTPSTIEKYNSITQRHRLYQFLWALDEKYDSIKREILNRDPLPTVRYAYGMVRRESANGRTMKPAGENQETGVGIGLAAIDRSRQNHPPAPPPAMSNAPNPDRGKMPCNHCGGKKHSIDTCFYIHGFPDWWEEMKRNRQNRNRSGGGGRATAEAATGDRATTTNKMVGSVGQSGSHGDGKAAGGEEKGAIALVSVARVWTEGNPSATTTGDGSPAKGRPGATVWEEDRGRGVCGG